MDFDQSENRREYADPFIPDDLKDRVYILGVENGEAEDFKKDCGMMSYEDIGMSLAKECNAEPNNGHPKVWSMERLQHNAAVIARLASDVRAKKIVCFHNDFTP